MREEIEILGGNYDRRGAWSDEAIRIMRACWSEERARYQGEFFSFDEIGVVPPPPRKAIPIWVGGHTPRALRRVDQGERPGLLLRLLDRMGIGFSS